MALVLHKSNRSERLVDALASIVVKPLSNVFQAEWVTVSSPGMERWLSLELSKRLGVWANPAFPFPRKLIESALSALLPLSSTADALAYDPTCMLFAIARLLRARHASAEFATANRYYADDPTGQRRLQLAERLAELFDQYVTYRPDLVLSWAAGGGDDFQSALFHALAQQYGPAHIAARARDALQLLAAGALPSGLPERLHLFGISTLPPLYVDILAQLAQRIDVHLFLLSPSREYLGELAPAPRRRRAKVPGRQLSFGESGFRAERLQLLASLGKHGREFQDLLEERTQYRDGAADLYIDPGTDTLLHTLQSDFLALRERGNEAGSAARVTLDAADHSLSIHACHGLMREVEVLHDQLVQLISERGVEPHDIIVMTPSIGDYAPVIEAVFGQAAAQRPLIPYRIADRSLAVTEPLLVALEAVLDVLQSRFGANQVLDLLGIDLVRSRFGIAADQVDSLRDWVADSGIRWGVDAEHRGEVRQPARVENTWRFGLSRLVLGFSTGAPSAQMFAGVAPAAVDSGDGPLLGNFLAFCQCLFELRSELRTAATPHTWSLRLGRVLEACFDAELSGAAEQKLLRRALLELEQHAARAEFDEPLELSALRRLLTRTLSLRAPAQGFLWGGVTFCQLMPMRSIPFKVLCLLGLNDGVFPAVESPSGLDLLKRQPKPGDRSRRNDDRQLFLEALLSARDTLIITYIGQSLKDGKPQPPSVLVSELIEHCAESFELPAADVPAPVGSLQRIQCMEQRLVLRHPLSAASPRYFGTDPDPRLFSYALTAVHAATAASQPRQRAPAFCVLTHGAAEPSTSITLAELERALIKPSRAFCQQRLALYLGGDVALVQDREPFALDNLERWRIATDMLAGERAGVAPEHLLAVQRAEGRLPLAAAGQVVHDTLRSDVDAIVAAHGQAARGERLSRVSVDLALDGVRLVGSIDEVYASAHVRAQYGRLGNHHELRHYIRHVVLCCVARATPGAGLPETSTLIGRHPSGGIGQVSFGRLTDPERVLRELLAIHAAALRAPLPLFPAASRRYAEVFAIKQSAELALVEARDAFSYNSGAQRAADQADDYIRQLYPDFDTVLRLQAAEFISTALRLYGPLIATRSDP